MIVIVNVDIHQSLCHFVCYITNIVLNTLLFDPNCWTLWKQKQQRQRKTHCRMVVKRSISRTVSTNNNNNNHSHSSNNLNRLRCSSETYSSSDRARAVQAFLSDSCNNPTTNHNNNNGCYIHDDIEGTTSSSSASIGGCSSSSVMKNGNSSSNPAIATRMGKTFRSAMIRSSPTSGNSYLPTTTTLHRHHSSTAAIMMSANTGSINASTTATMANVNGKYYSSFNDCNCTTATYYSSDDEMDTSKNGKYYSHTSSTSSRLRRSLRWIPKPLRLFTMKQTLILISISLLMTHGCLKYFDFVTTLSTDTFYIFGQEQSSSSSSTPRSLQSARNTFVWEKDTEAGPISIVHSSPLSVLDEPGFEIPTIPLKGFLHSSSRSSSSSHSSSSSSSTSTNDNSSDENNTKTNKKDDNTVALLQALIEKVKQETKSKELAKERFVETIDVPFHINTDSSSSSSDTTYHHNELQYRRVCTNVGSHSLLCMIVRFPFQFIAGSIHEDDPTSRIPQQPVEDEFYKLNKDNIYHFTPYDWDQCSTNKNTNIIDKTVITDYDQVNTIHTCIANKAIDIASTRTDKQEPVTVFWTRQSTIQGTTSKVTRLHSVGDVNSINRIYKYFGNDHEIIVLGDNTKSTTSGITESLSDMLGSKCDPTYVHAKPNYNCINPRIPLSQQIKSSYATSLRGLASMSRSINHIPSINSYRQHIQQQQQQQPYNLSFASLEESRINIGVIDISAVVANRQQEPKNRTSIVDTLQILQRQNGWTKLRNLTIIVNYPLSQIIQTEYNIKNEPNTILQKQKQISSFVMEIQSKFGQQQLMKQGYQLQTIIVFDGLQQFYPTSTSAFTNDMIHLQKDSISTATTTATNLNSKSKCIGPLPKHSYLKEINDNTRQLLFDRNFNDHWYGRSWEFTNLFWWQVSMYSWKHDGLDCTHNDQTDGINGMHRFFVQAMIDDYLEDKSDI